MTESEQALTAAVSGALPEARPSALKQALHQARTESAERIGVVVDMRDAELARLELLNEALDPVFADIPAKADIFDRGLTRGEPPRLWIDMVAHVAMGRDKRSYRLAQDSRHGRRILAESANVEEIKAAVTRYIARRLIERDRALAGDSAATDRDIAAYLHDRRRRLTWSAAAFVIGALCGAGGLLAIAWFRF